MKKDILCGLIFWAFAMAQCVDAAAAQLDAVIARRAAHLEGPEAALILAC